MPTTGMLNIIPLHSAKQKITLPPRAMKCIRTASLAELNPKRKTKVLRQRDSAQLD